MSKGGAPSHFIVVTVANGTWKWNGRSWSKLSDECALPQAEAPAPIGYAVVMDNGIGPFAGCYRVKSVAEMICKRQPAAHNDVVIPVYAAPPVKPGRNLERAVELLQSHAAMIWDSEVNWGGPHKGEIDDPDALDEYEELLRVAASLETLRVSLGGE